MNEGGYRLFALEFKRHAGFRAAVRSVSTLLGQLRPVGLAKRDAFGIQAQGGATLFHPISTGITTSDHRSIPAWIATASQILPL